MENKKFSLSDALTFGFYTLIENFGLYIKLVLTIVGIFALGATGIAILGVFLFSAFRSVNFQMDSAEAIQQVASQVSALITPYHVFGFIVLSTLLTLLYGFIFLSVTGVYLDLVDGKTVSIKNLFTRKHLTLKATIATFLYCLLVLTGLVFFIIPGIIAAITYGFFMYELVDKDCGIIDAFKHSAEITYGSRWNLFSFALLKVALSSLAGQLFLIPLLIVNPMFNLAYAYIYRKLQGRQLPIKQTT